MLIETQLAHSTLISKYCRWILHAYNRCFEKIKGPYSRQKSFTKTLMLLMDIGCNLLVASTETMANNLVGLLMSSARNNFI